MLLAGPGRHSCAPLSPLTQSLGGDSQQPPSRDDDPPDESRRGNRHHFNAITDWMHKTHSSEINFKYLSCGVQVL